MRRRFWTALLLVVTFPCAVVALLLATADPVNRRNYNRIQKGMSVSDVRGVLGVPPTTDGDWWPGCRLQTWKGRSDKSLIRAYYDQDGQVVETTYWQDESL